MSHPIIANTPENIKRPVIISSAAGYLQFRYRGQMHRYSSKKLHYGSAGACSGKKLQFFLVNAGRMC